MPDRSGIAVGGHAGPHPGRAVQRAVDLAAIEKDRHEGIPVLEGAQGLDGALGRDLAAVEHRGDGDGEMAHLVTVGPGHVDPGPPEDEGGGGEPDEGDGRREPPDQAAAQARAPGRAWVVPRGHGIM